MHALPFGFVYLLPLTAALGLALRGPFVFLPWAFIFVFTPVVDALVSTDERNGTEEEFARRDRNPLYKFWLYAFLPTLLALFGTALWMTKYRDLSSWELVGTASSLGLIAGAGGITIAHELMHRPGKFDRFVAELLMLLVSYPHFCIEHVYGHHKHVSTPLDPGSAAKGENLYAFLPSTLLGSIKSAWKIESRRVSSRRAAGTRVNFWEDKRVRMPILTLGVWAAIVLGVGPQGLALFALCCVVAVLLLETINYVEHYGLARRRRDDGRYERVQPEHSWNSPHRLTGYYLFALPRHADHHYQANRPYWRLRHVDEGPQLPAGYATMVLVALVPPLWFSVMDPRVDAEMERLQARVHDAGAEVDAASEVNLPAPPSAPIAAQSNRLS